MPWSQSSFELNHSHLFMVAPRPFSMFLSVVVRTWLPSSSLTESPVESLLSNSVMGLPLAIIRTSTTLLMVLSVLLIDLTIMKSSTLARETVPRSRILSILYNSTPRRMPQSTYFLSSPVMFHVSCAAAHSLVFQMSSWLCANKDGIFERNLPIFSPFFLIVRLLS